MNIKLEENQQNIKVNYLDERLFFEKGGIVIDRFCPKCRRILFKEKSFCDCGFFLKANKNSGIWSIFLTTILSSLVLFVCLNFFIQFNIQKIVGEQSNKPDLISISPLNIQILSRLKDFEFKSYIQNIYVKPDQSTIVILIKPSVWNKLEKVEKDKILKFINEKWSEIYYKNYPDSKKKPNVYFGNSG